MKSTLQCAENDRKTCWTHARIKVLSFELRKIMFALKFMDVRVSLLLQRQKVSQCCRGHMLVLKSGQKVFSFSSHSRAHWIGGNTGGGTTVTIESNHFEGEPSDDFCVIVDAPASFKQAVCFSRDR